MSQNGSAKYGWRARIGMIIPSTNAVAEPQVRMMAPDGVEFHTTRLAFAGTSEANVTRFIAEAGDGAKLLADAGVDMVVLNCTAATMFRPGIDAEAVGIMTEASGKKCTTVSRGVVDALRTLEARRVVLTSPYETNAREQAFLEHHQIAVLNEVGLKLKPQQFPKVEPGDWYRQVRAQEECPVMVQLKSSAMQSANGLPLPFASSAKTPCRMRLFSLALMVSASNGLMESPLDMLERTLGQGPRARTRPPRARGRTPETSCPAGRRPIRPAAPHCGSRRRGST